MDLKNSVVVKSPNKKELNSSKSQHNILSAACVLFAKNGFDGTHLVTINEIAAQFSIPRNHLIKALNLLVRLNWISSIRGRSGGLRYNSESDTLKLGDIILVLEAKPELFNYNECRLHANCLLRSILKESLNAFYANLNKYTLTDLTKGKTGNFINHMIHHPKL